MFIIIQLARREVKFGITRLANGKFAFKLTKYLFSEGHSALHSVWTPTMSAACIGVSTLGNL